MRGAARLGGDALDRRVDQLMEAWGQGPWIFNLGHGVLPATDPGVLTDLVALVHSL